MTEQIAAPDRDSAALHPGRRARRYRAEQSSVHLALTHKDS
jgi:hypothetical protein